MRANMSMYMIKPEAMPHREEIRERIGHHLTLGETKMMRLPDWAMNELYDDLTEDLRRATRVTLENPVELGLVHGEDAIMRLLELAGDKTSPRECHPDSIRYQFGIRDPMVVGGARYFLNAIHRPKTLEEAATHIALFRRL